MRKVVLSFAYLVVALFLLSTFGWVVKHVVQGTKDFGEPINSGIKTFVGFLDLSQETVKEVKSLPETFIATPNDFESINKLTEDLWALVAFSDKDKLRTVELRNFRNDSVAHSWQVGNVKEPHHRLMHPLMLSDSSLVYSFNGASGIKRIDKNNKLIWAQDSIEHHHSFNLDHQGNIWLCSSDLPNPTYGIVYRGTVFVDGMPVRFFDGKFSKIDSKTGRILFHKSTAQLIHENGLEHLFAKTDNAEDPMHLNDVQPVLKDGPYWKQGDVFLSFRNMSCILQYRPSADTVVRLIEGPFYAQHDIDILNDSTLSIFNNNAYIRWQNGGTTWAAPDSTYQAAKLFSNIVYYYPGSNSFEFKDKQLFDDNNIYTFTEGLDEHLSDGSVFVEEQNSGILWVIKNGEVIYKNILPSHHKGYHHLPNWTRLMEELTTLYPEK